MAIYKHFNKKKYYLCENRWFQTSNRQRLSHDIWNYYYPENPIRKGEVIHHINGNSKDDRIENLEKLSVKEHNSLHSRMENNSNWKGGISLDRNAWFRKYRKTNYKTKNLFNCHSNEDCFYLNVYIKYNLKTKHIIYATEWREYKHNNRK